MLNNKNNRWMLAALALAGLGTIGLAYASPARPQVSASVPTISHGPAVGPRATTPAPRVVAQGHRTHSSPVATSAPATVASTAAAEKTRLLEEHRADQVAQVRELGLDGPRPDPTIELQDVQSNTELELGAQLKAEQARRLSDALSDRAATVQERIETARADGDEDEAARQSRILARLQARTGTLSEHAVAFADEAQTQGEAEGSFDEHGHEHAP